MILLDDASSEREADPPPARLRRESGLEDLSAQLARDARSVVGDAQTGAAARSRHGAKADGAASASERIDRVLHEHLERPLEEHGVSPHVDRIWWRAHLDRDGVSELRHAGAEVGRDPLDQLTRVDRIAARLTTDALEAVGDAIEPLEVGAHVADRLSRPFVRGAILEEL